VSWISFDAKGSRIDTHRLDVLSEVDMIAKRDHRYWQVNQLTKWPASEKPYELVTICLWSVVAVVLSAFLMWLALGGQV
jgi:hypothetical protein